MKRTIGFVVSQIYKYHTWMYFYKCHHPQEFCISLREGAALTWSFYPLENDLSGVTRLHHVCEIANSEAIEDQAGQRNESRSQGQEDIHGGACSKP